LFCSTAGGEGCRGGGGCSCCLLASRALVIGSVPELCSSLKNVDRFAISFIKTDIEEAALVTSIPIIAGTDERQNPMKW
jgi:hypothetical protein